MLSGTEISVRASNSIDGAVEHLISAQSAWYFLKEQAEAPPEIVADTSGVLDGLGERICQSRGAIARSGLDE